MDVLRSLDPFDTGWSPGVIAGVVCAVLGGSLSTVVLLGATMRWSSSRAADASVTARCELRATDEAATMTA